MSSLALTSLPPTLEDEVLKLPNPLLELDALREDTLPDRSMMLKLCLLALEEMVVMMPHRACG